MMKVGIIVSQDFFSNHVGVRNLVMGLGSLLSERVRVDYLARHPNPSSSGQWYSLQPLSRRYAADNSVVENIRVEGGPREVLRQYRALVPNPAAPAAVLPHTAIGSDLAAEGYDVLILSSPWCVNFDGRLPAARVIGLALDTIPNTIGFTSWDIRPFAFASEHARGYRYYRDHADLVYAISRDTADSLAALFSIPADKLVALPPFLPIGYSGRTIPEVERGPNLILAAPFDLRKGIAILPALINPVAGALGKLFVYGTPRCESHLVSRFFDELDPRLQVVWYPAATTDVVASLFAASRLLLFPSRQEGLGLPLLEAQVCGARVAAFGIPPMIDNMLAGAIRLGPSREADAAAIAAAIADAGFDHAGLARQAAEKFSFDAIRSTLLATVGGPSATR